MSYRNSLHLTDLTPMMVDVDIDNVDVVVNDVVTDVVV